jgi:hypothetical protein
MCLNSRVTANKYEIFIFKTYLTTLIYCGHVSLSVKTVACNKVNVGKS